MKKSIDNHIDDFLHKLDKVLGYSQLTVKSYKESLKEAFEIIETTQNGKEYIFNLMPYRMKISKLKPKTISKKLSAIHTFCDYLNENSIKTKIQANESVKVPKTLPKPISHKHILEALKEASLQEKLIVTLLYTLGLRISELASIKKDDIHDGWLRVLGKGSKQRDLPIIDSTNTLLERYLQNNEPKQYLFEKNGKKLSENSLRYIVTKIFNRVAIKVTPHQLRHSYASSLLNGGAPIVDVSELLGHSSMATTQIYTKLGSALKQQNYNKAHPLCGVDDDK